MLKKTILLILLGYWSVNLSAATLTYYTEKEIGDREYGALNTAEISTLYYEEDDKILQAAFLRGASHTTFNFKVNTLEEAQGIIKKVFDSNDSSFIELELD